MTYPDSGATTHSYNALGETIKVVDAAGTTIRTEYDTGGRMTHRRATATGSGIDTAVLRVSTAYTTRGQVDTVTQYDNATVGSGSVVDEVQYSYDEWGNATTFDQDWNSAISGDAVDVDYTWALANSPATAVYRALRCTGMTLPDGTSVSYVYVNASELGRHDNDLSRVLQVKVGATIVAQYQHQGLATLVGTEYPESDLLYTRYDTGGSFSRIDRFNRVTSDIWTRGIDTGGSSAYDVYRDFYDVDITWSRSSNIDLVEDRVYPNWDVAYTNDGLERLTQAKRGTWGGSSITSPVHDEQWTLSQPGNWEVYKLDLNGDTDFGDADELNDDQTFNTVNELIARDTDDNGTDNYDLIYDDAGNLTDDDKDYEFIYDAFGRLVEVQNQSQQTVAEYTYNGLGYRTGWHYDVDGDGTVEANASSTPDDPWFQFVYDTRWRITATYRASHYSTWTIDSSPKEQFVSHNAGLDGTGGSSYIDSVILRDRDANTDWEDQADGTLESRGYYCQNWRADVVALVNSSGSLRSQVRYDPYGVPFGIAKTDLDADGDVDASDASLYTTLYNGGSGTHPYADWNWDGATDGTDPGAYTASKSVDSGLGRGVGGYDYSNAAAGANRKLYAGYEIDPVLTGSEGWESVYHVRHRGYLSQLGRWTRRDPIGYAGGIGAYRYANCQGNTLTDPTGLKEVQLPPCPDDVTPCVPDCEDLPFTHAPVLQNPDTCYACVHQNHSFGTFTSSRYGSKDDMQYDWWVTVSGFIKAKATNRRMELYGTGVLEGRRTSDFDPTIKEIHARYDHSIVCTDFNDGWIGLPASSVQSKVKSFESARLEWWADIRWRRLNPPDNGRCVSVTVNAAFVLHILESPIRFGDSTRKAKLRLLGWFLNLDEYESVTVASLDFGATWCCESCKIR